MKGVIFNLLESVVTDAHGEQAWEALLDDAGLEGTYTAVGSYPDADLFALVAAGARRFETSEPELVRWFGRSAIPLLAERYPAFFEAHHSVRTFLPTLNDVIHAEVRKLYPEAEVPTFEFVAGSGDSVRMAYRSPRRLCALAEGFIEGAGDHFGEVVTVRQSECMLEGADRCLLVVAVGDGP